MNRRKFITDTCLSCALIAGGGMLAGMLESCSGLPRLTSTKDDVYSFDATAFGESNVLVLQRSNAEFDALVVKNTDGTYHTLEMKCTHRDQPLTANKSGLYCASHGSAFTLKGDVTIEPAIDPLHRFRTELNNSAITVYFKS